MHHRSFTLLCTEWRVNQGTSGLWMIRERRATHTGIIREVAANIERAIGGTRPSTCA